MSACLAAPAAVRERPILFRGDMINALRQRRKTQTRRVIKPVRGFERHNICRPDMAALPWTVWWHGDVTERVGCMQECPYGKPGERLWVREQLYRRSGGWFYAADSQLIYVTPENETAMHVWAHHKRLDYCPSIHMPRWASRITLEIAAVRAQHVLDISGEDAIAEGISISRCGCEVCAHSGQMCPADRSAAHDEYLRLWGEINGKTYPAHKNPLAWVITMKLLRGAA